MTEAFRASFDPFFHRFDFPFSDDAAALRYMRDFSGTPVLKMQAVHELVHFYYAISPVSRAISALRARALFTLISAGDLMETGQRDEIDGPAVVAAVTQWRIAEATTQALLPLYEGAALMGEFDCHCIPIPSASDVMTFQMVQIEQLRAALRAGEIPETGSHGQWGWPDQTEGYLLDALAEQLLDDDVVARKRVLLGLPLEYEKPADCYLTAWLLARSAHQRISAMADENVDPAFVVKYLRSFFLEDWTLVSLILDVFDGTVQNNSAILMRIHERLVRLGSDFTRREYDAYRQGVLDHLEPRGQNMEHLPGLMFDSLVEQDQATSFRLLESMTLLGTPHDLDDRRMGFWRALTTLQNRSSYAKIHAGEYRATWVEDAFLLSSGGEELRFECAGVEPFDSQVCTVSFHLAAGGEVLQRLAHFRLCERTIVGWTGGRELGAIAMIGQIYPMIQASEEAERYIGAHIRLVSRIFADDFALATREGCQSGRALFSDWLDHRSDFYSNLRKLASGLGHDTMPRSTFRLFRNFVDDVEMGRLIRRSISYGVGYNLGSLTTGEHRERWLRGSNFRTEIAATYAMRDVVRFDLQFFYVEETPDGAQIPRYYF